MSLSRSVSPSQNKLVTEEEKRNQCSPGPLLNQTLLKPRAGF